MVRKLFGIFFNRWTFIAFGFLALALLIWFGGPFLAIAEYHYHPLGSELVRAVLIGLILLLYFGRLSWRAWRSRRANAGCLKGSRRRPRAMRQRKIPKSRCFVVGSSRRSGL